MIEENEEGPDQPTDVAAAAAVDALGMYSTAASALAAGASQVLCVNELRRQFWSCNSPT